MGLLKILKKATCLKSVGESKRKDCSIMTENRQPAPAGALEADGGRKQKSFWKWVALHFPSRRTGTYDLARAEDKYGIELETDWRDSDAPAPENLPAAEEQQKHSVLDKSQSVHKPCVQPKDTPITSENRHPNLSDGAVETDGERKKAGREKEKNSFWKWPALHFPCSRAGTYDVARAEEKYGIEAETHQRPTNAPAPEVLPAAEEQQKRNALDKGHIRKQYKIVCKLGEGGFGLVYEATRRKDGLKVAIKFSMKTQTMPSIRLPGYPESLPMEIGLMLMANKGPSVPQIIKLLDWEDDTDHYVMVMERPVPCMDLHSFLKLRGGSLDEGTARHVLRQVVHAANICSKRGVFHRDIKLENLLVNINTMKVKLIDFGCGALMRKSAFKSFSGTREYCPPEVKANHRYHAKPTLVWTLGILLFAMVCGHFPTDLDLNRTSKNNFIRPGLSRECCQMICGCLQPDPKQRLILERMRHHDWFKVTK